MVVFFFILVDATVVACLAGHRREVVVSDDFLLFVVSGMLPDPIFSVEHHFAVLDDTVVVVRIVKLALFTTTVLLTHKLAVLLPEVLAVPVGLLLHQIRVACCQINSSVTLFIANG